MCVWCLPVHPVYDDDASGSAYQATKVYRGKYVGGLHMCMPEDSNVDWLLLCSHVCCQHMCTADNKSKLLEPCGNMGHWLLCVAPATSTRAATRAEAAPEAFTMLQRLKEQVGTSGGTHGRDSLVGLRLGLLGGTYGWDFGWDLWVGLRVGLMGGTSGGTYGWDSWVRLIVGDPAMKMHVTS